MTAERDADADEVIFCLHSGYVDGNFRLRHETSRGRATKHDAPIQHFFVKKVKRHTASCQLARFSCQVFATRGDVRVYVDVSDTVI